MSDEKDFFQLTAAKEMRFVKHNETDFERFKAFQKEQEARFSQLEDKKEKKEIVANLNKWDDSLAQRWRGGVLTHIENPAAKDVIAIIDREQFTSLYLKGESGSGKTFISCAAMRRYIGMGWVTPSQIKMISEEALMGLANLGFEGRRRVEELFNPRYKMYLFDNVGSKDSYREWELALWEQLIDHIYSKSLHAVFTSTKSAEDFAVRLSDSGDSKFRHLVSGRIVRVKGEGLPQLDEPEAGSKGNHDQNILDNFSS